MLVGRCSVGPRTFFPKGLLVQGGSGETQGSMTPTILSGLSMGCLLNPLQRPLPARQPPMCRLLRPHVGERRALAWARLEGRGLVKYSLDGKASETEYLAVGHSRVCLPSSGSNNGSSSGSGGGGGGSSNCSSGGPCAASKEAGQLPEECLAATAPGAAMPGGSGCGGQEAAAAAGEPGGAAGAPGAMRWVTTLDLFPHTGRTHQLRRHMALIGYPLVGDRKYTHGYAKQRADNGIELPLDGHIVLAGGSGCTGGAAQLATAGRGAAEVPQGSPGGDAALPLQQPAGRSQQQRQAEHGGPYPTESGEGLEHLGSEERLGSGGANWSGVMPAPSPVAALAPGAARERGMGASYASPVLCLWAVQLTLEHPITGEQLHFELGEPQIYEVIRGELGATGGL